jgi:hypothetical protein
MSRLVTKRVCTRCSRPSPCDCAQPNPVPAELAAWQGAFLPWPGAPFEVEVLDDGLPATRVRLEDVVEIAYHAAGRGDGPPWIAVVRVSDGRWAYISHTVQITGELYWTQVVARSKERLWWGALTEDDRARFTPQMTGEEREAEDVALDEMLESQDPDERERAMERVMWLRQK